MRDQGTGRVRLVNCRAGHNRQEALASLQCLAGTTGAYAPGWDHAQIDSKEEHTPGVRVAGHFEPGVPGGRILTSIRLPDIFRACSTGCTKLLPFLSMLAQKWFLQSPKPQGMSNHYLPHLPADVLIVFNLPGPFSPKAGSSCLQARPAFGAFVCSRQPNSRLRE